MTSERNINKEPQSLPLALRNARRKAGMTQAGLAVAVGCAQSAVSMMEKGRTDALARDKLEEIARKLDVDLSAYSIEQKSRHVTGFAFCPNYECPSNRAYLAGNDVFFWPEDGLMILPDAVYCRYCGEVLVRNCCVCGRPAAEGACCRHCGNAYIQPDPAAVTRFTQKLIKSIP